LSSAIAQTESEGGFGSFSLNAALLDALDAADFRTPRPIQTETIPACLDGRDVMGLAQTGTGKTAAFALPILHRNIRKRSKATRTLILAPTRELANQIADEIRMLAQFTNVSTFTVFGGIPLQKHIRGLKRRPDIVVGCPGRVLDLLNRGALDLSQVDTLVLDEADHMFDMGFLPDLKKILAKLPAKRQNLLFSATMPRAIRSLADQVLTDPHVVELAPSAPSERVEHYLHKVQEGAKSQLLQDVLSAADCSTAIVFMRTKHRAKRTAQQLAKLGKNAVALQGNMSQAQRDRAMAGFREGKYDVLVATDIAARGLDVAGIDYVVNFDVPNTAEAYTHRIGRTGRSDASGKACTFVTPSDRAWVRSTEKVLGSSIPIRKAPGDHSTGSAKDEAFELDSERRRPRRKQRARRSGGSARNGSKSGTSEKASRSAKPRSRDAGEASDKPAKPARRRRPARRKKASGRSRGASTASGSAHR
jgi:ATP-dependent RNA helicase RhlE